MGIENTFFGIAKQCTDIVSSIFSWEGLCQTVVYKRFAGQQSNGRTHVDTYTDFSITGWKSMHTKHSQFVVANMGGKTEIQVGDVVYMFKHEEFPENASLKDLILVDSVTCRIKSILPIFWVVDLCTLENG
jgi:hypothetical protein